MKNIFELGMRYRAEQPRAAAVTDAMQVVREAAAAALREQQAPTLADLWRDMYSELHHLRPPSELTGAARLGRVQAYLRAEYAAAVQVAPVPMASWASRLELGVAYGD